MKKEKFLENPNLPENKVSAVIVSNRISEVVDELKNYGIRTVLVERLDGVNGEEAYHADISICHLGDDKFVSAKNTKLIKCLENMNADITQSSLEISGCYPNIAALNVCIFGSNLICNTKSADRNIIDFCQRKGYKILHTNQGYTKCSSAIISENALITSDNGIYRICKNNNIDVLKISAGGIELSGYNYGFIGGTCGFIDKKILAFSGNIKMHKDFSNIKDFVKNYGVDIISLSLKPLYDIGGILPIFEMI